MRRLAPLLLLLAAAAAPPPLYLPTRDVSVDYRLQADGPHPETVTMDYSAASGRARIGSPGGPVYAIVDRRAGRLLLVVDLLRAVMEQRFDAAEGYGLRIGRDATFTPLGAERVAGAACRDWTVRAAQGEATACLTPDGVILRARYDGRRGHAALEAVRASWGARAGGAVRGAGRLLGAAVRHAAAAAPRPAARRVMLRVAFLGAALAAAPAAAAVPDRPPGPPALPTRDVDVTYATDAGGRVLTQRMRWAQVLRKLRVDPPTAGLFIVTDYAARRTSVVRAQDRTVLEAPAPPPGSQATYRRRGDDVVAGQGCTEWETQDTSGRPTTACITADGVMLRARAEGRTLVVATSVDFGKLDPSVFEIPPDYRRVSADAGK